MARLTSSGFELNSTTADVEFTTVTNGTIQTSTVRSGTYAGQITSLVTLTARGFEYQFASAAGNGPYYLRVYINVATLPSAANTIITLNNTTGLVGTPEASIKLDNTGAFSLFNGLTSQVGSASSTISTGTWHSLELWFDATGGVGGDTLKARLDGVEFASATNLTILAGVLAFTVGGNLNAEAQTTGEWYFDDIAINDSTGSFQNSYPGEGKIIHLRPNAAGDNSAWTGTFADIDEVTPDGTTFIVATGIINIIEDVKIEANFLNASSIINCVQLGFVYDYAGAIPGGGVDIRLRIKSEPSGTVETADVNIDTANVVTNAKAVPRNYPLTLYDLPGASTTAWTKDTLKTAQIGVEDITGDGDHRLDSMWLLVDYVSETTIGYIIPNKLRPAIFAPGRAR